MNRYYKTEGNILYPDKQMLTWGPYYYHSSDKAKECMDKILDDIINWVNLQDPSLNIQPELFIKAIGGQMYAFNIKAWKDDERLENCKGQISVENIFFEDEENE